VEAIPDNGAFLQAQARAAPIAATSQSDSVGYGEAQRSPNSNRFAEMIRNDYSIPQSHRQLHQQRNRHAKVLQLLT
jgi:hypothetical protein